MKKIMILPVSLLLMSCSFSSKSQNSEQALQDSIRVADSIAAVFGRRIALRFVEGNKRQQRRTMMKFKLLAGILLTPISNPLLALMVSIIQ